LASARQLRLPLRLLYVSYSLLLRLGALGLGLFACYQASLSSTLSVQPPYLVVQVVCAQTVEASVRYGAMSRVRYGAMLRAGYGAVLRATYGVLPVSQWEASPYMAKDFRILYIYLSLK
jgi:hypothetical protein